jgi:hypothetical protein
MNAIEELFKNEEEEDDEHVELVSNSKVELPPLVCPFKDKTRGWSSKIAHTQLTAYLKCAGYSHKKLKEGKPPFWPQSVSHKKLWNIPEHSRI